MTTREETKRMIEVMQAYVDGADIEYCENGVCCSVGESPSWLWDEFDYRVKRNTKKVKLLAWLSPAGYLAWFTADQELNTDKWKRIPAEDKEVEVEK